MATITRRSTRTLASLATEYAKDESADTDEEAPDEEAFEIPEDLSTLSDEDLEALHSQAVGYFETLYGDGSALTDEHLADLAALTEGIETLAAETATRTEAQSVRKDKAAALAGRAGIEFSSPIPEDEEEPPAEEEPVAPEDEEDEATLSTADAPAAVVASADSRRKGIRIPMSKMSGRPSAPRGPAPSQSRPGAPKRMRDVVFASDAPGYQDGAGMDFEDIALAVDKRLGSFNQALYQSAHDRGQSMREQGGIAVLRKPFPKQAIVASADPEHIEAVMSYAVNEANLPKGSLVASGGWCAPSEVLYDLLELESRDGLVSLPEINVARGGIMFTQGPSFADIYAATGFTFTEQQDIDGEYAPNPTPGQPNVAGDKPCYHIECPEFEEARLDVAGLCITAGLLQQRGYPEVLARTVRGALIAHDHKMSATLINAIVAGSTPVNMAPQQVGATAPILSAIELQVEHYRYTHRLSRTRTLEAIFPFWVRGAIRSDLSRRLGVDLINVTDATIASWFSLRGISPQFVYDWQALDGTAAGTFVAWPTVVKFVLYVAGTWVKGSSDVITLDTIYDSVNLGQNDFTALFTEEGWFVAKRGFDSRVITVNIEADGATAAGVNIDHDGSIGA